jgi:septum formation protein
LGTLGVAFRVRISNVEEIIQPGEPAAVSAERLARAKADAVARREVLPVLGADTVVLCEGRILGKPASAAEAAHMLRLLAGRRHEVLTGVCLQTGTTARSAVERTSVTFAPMTEEEIAWYVGSGEALDKAGAYHVDGRGSLFIESVDGSPSNVAGLPVRLFLRLVREAGLSLGLP